MVVRHKIATFYFKILKFNWTVAMKYFFYTSAMLLHLTVVTEILNYIKV